LDAAQLGAITLVHESLGLLTQDGFTMNLGQHPELLDKLAARYAVGVLKAGARRRLEAQARQSAAVRVRLLLWQERMHAMLELQPLSNDSRPYDLRNVWKRIENSLAALPEVVIDPMLAWPPLVQAREALAAMRRKYLIWCAGAVTAGCAAIVGWGLHLHGIEQLNGSTQQVAQLQQQIGAQAARQQVQYVAVLSDEQSKATVLATFDPDKRRLVLQRVSDYQEGPDKSLQIWAVLPGQAPLSLGLYGGEKVLRLTASPEMIGTMPLLAVSLEPKGGAPVGSGPTGPILFKGAVIKPVL
jgi:anti-sigma-K factor RskA